MNKVRPPRLLRAARWAVALALAAALEAPAQRIRGFNLTRSVELDGESLQIRVPSGAQPVTLPPPRALHGTRRADGAQVELFHLLELWRAPQRLGLWRTAAGHEVHAARVASAPPALPAEGPPLMTREEIDRRIAQAGAPGFDDDALLAWAESFTGASRALPLVRQADTISLQRVRAGALTLEGEALAVVFFSVKAGLHGADPDRLYAAFFRFAGGPSAEEAAALAARVFPPTVSAIGRPAAPPSAGAPARPGPGGPGAPEETPERARSREAVLQTIRGLPRWWSLEGERYIFVSDLSGTDRSFVERLSRNLGQFLEVYEALIPPMKPIEAVSAVRVFAEPRDYLQYVGPGHEWSGGMWDPSRRELIIRASGWQTGRDRRDSLANTVQHEALHQYLFYAFPGIVTAAWYNEGHATFMEGLELTPRGPRLGETDRAAAVDRAVAGGEVDFARLIGLSYPEFYAGGGTDWGRTRNYALAWALVYYLRKGAPDESDPRFAGILPRYEAALREGKRGEEARRAAFEGVSPEALGAAFTAFWSSPSRRAAARRRDPGDLYPAR